jgi:hypothetical protein
MLKRGHVYKGIFNVPSGSISMGGRQSRNYMIFSPREDIMNLSFSKKLDGLKTIFYIGFLGISSNDGEIGISKLIKVTTKFIDEDITEIEMVMKKYGWKYNKKLNRVEGYETV